MAKKPSSTTDATPIDLDGDSAGTLEGSFPNVEVWMSVKQAAEYTGKKKMQITKAITSGKLTARTRVVHEDYPPLTEISKADLDTWNAPKAPKIKTGGARATRGGQDRRWLCYISDSQIDVAKAALAPLGLTLTTAYRSKKQRAADKAEPNMETQAANATQSADLVDNSDPFNSERVLKSASTSDELELVEA